MSADAREEAREAAGVGVEVLAVERWRRKGEGGAGVALVAGDGNRRRRSWRRHILERRRSGGVGRVWDLGRSVLQSLSAAVLPRFKRPRVVSRADLRSDGQDGFMENTMVSDEVLLLF